MFRVDVKAFFSLGDPKDRRTVFYVEGVEEILLYRHLQKFILKAVYSKSSVEETSMFRLNYLNDALPVQAIENDPELLRVMELEKLILLREIRDKLLMLESGGV